MVKGQVERSKNKKPKSGQRRGTRDHVGSGPPATVAKAKTGKRDRRSVKKAKVVYDQARVDLLSSL